ncbi:MAG: hypothetical protein ACWA5W_11565 [Phycisphaerales bacterium]
MPLLTVFGAVVLLFFAIKEHYWALWASSGTLIRIENEPSDMA